MNKDKTPDTTIITCSICREKYELSGTANGSGIRTAYVCSKCEMKKLTQDKPQTQQR